jgi:Holliday junction resolvasome RuvABC endonuclease subunit
MTQFEENNPEQLRQFISQLRQLVDEFHPNIYLIDDVFRGINIIEQAIREKLHEPKEDK